MIEPRDGGGLRVALELPADVPVLGLPARVPPIAYAKLMRHPLQRPHPPLRAAASALGAVLTDTPQPIDAHEPPPRQAPRPWPLALLALATLGVIVLAVTALGAPASSTRTSQQFVTAANGVVQTTVTGTATSSPPPT